MTLYQRSNGNLWVKSGGGMWSSSVAGGGSFDYYISPAGSNSNDGLTTSTPWAITALASKSAIAGKRVGLMDGTYTATGSGGLGGTAILWPCNYGGTLANPTIIEAVNARAAIFDGLIGGSGTQYTEQSILGTEQDYVYFKNLTLKRAKQKLMYLGGDNCRIEGCDFSDLDNQRSSDINGANPTGDNCEAIFIQGPGTGVGQRNSGNVVSNCKFATILNGTNSPNAAAIKIYDSENNTVEYCTATGMNNLVFEKSNSAGTTVRYCYGYSLYQMINGVGSNYANGTWRGTPSSYTCYIYQNLCRDSVVFFESHSNGDPTDQNVQFYNNTFYTTQDSFNAMSWRGSSAGRITCRDSIIYHETGTAGYGDIRFTDSSSLASSLDYMLYPGTLKFTSPLGGSPHTTLASWRSASGFDANSATTNPSFANKGGTAATDYKISGAALTASSTAGPVGCYITGAETIGCNF